MLLIELGLPVVQDFRVLTLLYVKLFAVALVMVMVMMMVMVMVMVMMMMTVLPVEGQT